MIAETGRWRRKPDRQGGCKDGSSIVGEGANSFCTSLTVGFLACKHDIAPKG